MRFQHDYYYGSWFQSWLQQRGYPWLVVLSVSVILLVHGPLYAAATSSTAPTARTTTREPIADRSVSMLQLQDQVAQAVQASQRALQDLGVVTEPRTHSTEGVDISSERNNQTNTTLQLPSNQETIQQAANEIRRAKNFIHNHQEHVRQPTERLIHLLHEHNMAQLQALHDHLNVVMAQELQRRENESIDDDDDDVVNTDLDNNQDDDQAIRIKEYNQPIPLDELDELLDPHALLDESEEVLANHWADVMDELLDEYQFHAVQDFANKLNQLEQDHANDNAILDTDDNGGASTEDDDLDTDQSDIDDDGEHYSGPSACISPAQAAQTVHEALLRYEQDGIGLFDHLQAATATNGGHAAATIVHERTSPTYKPPSLQQHMMIGNVWWIKYIPQDWLDWLPDGWESWNVIRIPAFWAHSIHGWSWRGSSTSFFSNQIMSHLLWTAPTGVAPPEAILEPHVQPGSCWPMQGSTGTVTIRLPYPVAITAVSIDHVSARIVIKPPPPPRQQQELDDDNNNMESSTTTIDNTDDTGMLTSAPRQFHVWGWPPCKVNDVVCHATGLGFDDNTHYDDPTNNRKRLGLLLMTGEYQYSNKATATQTFWIHPQEEQKQQQFVDDAAARIKPFKSLLDDDDDDVNDRILINEDNVDDMAGSCSAVTASCSAGGSDSVDNEDDDDVGSQTATAPVVAAIQLEIMNNYGNPDYTCLYRLRVHGDRQD